MTECDNADIRDLLPDYVAETMSGDARAHVETHVTSCIACTEEVVLLRAMRAARPAAVAIDVARIVSALPRPSVAAPALRLVPPDARASDVPRRMTRAPVWRMAAAIGVAALGGWTVLSNRAGVEAAGSPAVQVAVDRATDSLRVTPAAPVGESSMTVATTDTPRVGDAVTSTPRATAATTSTLSVGDLSEYSDDDLQRMLDRLEKWDGATSADPLPTVPILPVTERGIR